MGTSNVVCAVCGSPRLGILHHLDIAVIGGEQHHAMGFLDRRAQLSQAFVDRIDRLIAASIMPV